MTYLSNTNRTLKEDILKQYDALEGLNLSLNDRIKIISSDISYRHKMLYSVTKIIVTNTFVDFVPTVPTLQ